MTKAYLYSPTHPKNTVELNEFLSVGSDSQNQLALQKADVSERHARIELLRGQYSVRDLHSTEGTFVNGVQILQSFLKPGDEISFGCNTWIFSDVLPNHQRLKSRCPSWDGKLAFLPQIASTDFPVLLLGPSGSGKDVLANFLHQSSKRSGGPFVSVNCSAFTENLAESEFFGHLKGSFTGAVADRRGAFEAARGGTLFLDEIGDLSLNLQSKLLRVLENKEIKAVGSDRSVLTDVRILAATHQNLGEKITDGSFRQDLYYRLSAVTVKVPALQERIEDFEELIFLFARQYRIRFSHDAIAALKKRQWPGNIRELRNVVARAKAYHSGSTVEVEHIEHLVDSPANQLQKPNLGANAVASLPVVKEFERQMILQRLAVNRGNQRRTATELGMPKSTLHDRLKLYQIDPQEFMA